MNSHVIQKSFNEFLARLPSPIIIFWMRPGKSERDDGMMRSGKMEIIRVDRWRDRDIEQTRESRRECEGEVAWLEGNFRLARERDNNGRIIFRIKISQQCNALRD